MSQARSAVEKRRQFLVALLWIALAILIAWGIWWWVGNMHQVWRAKPNPSEALQKNPMLAATRLFEKSGYQIQQEAILSENFIRHALPGTMIIANTDGLMSQEQSQLLLAWVARGNTLISFPKIKQSPKSVKEVKFPSDEDEAEPEEETAQSPNSAETRSQRVATGHLRDPIGEFLGVTTVFDQTQSTHAQDTTTQSAHVILNLPNIGHLLQLRKTSWQLTSTEKGKTPLYSDDSAQVLRVYTHGTGHIVLMSENLFELQELRYFDHAEVLLALTAINQPHKNVSIVQRLKISTWYELLWQAFPMAICLLALTILLSAWRAVSRFGPLLPELSVQRRSLMEHVEASARWGWSSDLGRRQLLSAARTACHQSMQRHAPELLNLTIGDLITQLAQETSFSQEQLQLALQSNVSKLPPVFTRQIQILQQLRMHYER